MAMNDEAAELLAEIERTGSGSRVFSVRFWQALDHLSDMELRRVLAAVGGRAAPVRARLANRFPLAAYDIVRESDASRETLPALRPAEGKPPRGQG
jgi:hypothetical protein